MVKYVAFTLSLLALAPSILAAAVVARSAEPIPNPNDVEVRSLVPFGKYTWNVTDFNLTQQFGVFEFNVEGGNFADLTPAFLAYCTGSDDGVNRTAACIFKSDPPKGGNFDVDVEILISTVVSINGTLIFTDLVDSNYTNKYVGEGIVEREKSSWTDTTIYPVGVL